MDWKYVTNIFAPLSPEDTVIAATVRGPEEEKIAVELGKLLQSMNHDRMQDGGAPVKFIVNRIDVKQDPMSNLTEGGADNAEREGRLPSDL